MNTEQRETDTPRTDAAANDSIVKVYETSKQLEIALSKAERERDEARTQAESLRDAFIGQEKINWNKLPWEEPTR